jgi:hypothetical protein
MTRGYQSEIYDRTPRKRQSNIGRNIGYALIAAPLIAGAVWGIVDIVRDYRADTKAANTALEQKDTETAKRLIRKVEDDTSDGSLVVSLSRAKEDKLRDMIKNNTSK